MPDTDCPTLDDFSGEELRTIATLLLLLLHFDPPPSARRSMLWRLETAENSNVELIRLGNELLEKFTFIRRRAMVRFISRGDAIEKVTGEIERHQEELV